MGERDIYYINANGLESEITEQDNMRNDINKF